MTAKGSFCVRPNVIRMPLTKIVLSHNMDLSIKEGLVKWFYDVLGEQPEAIL